MASCRLLILAVFSLVDVDGACEGQVCEEHAFIQLHSAANTSHTSLLSVGRGRDVGNLDQVKANVRQMAMSRVTGNAEPFNVSQFNAIFQAILDDMDSVIGETTSTATNDNAELVQLAGQLATCNSDLSSRNPDTVTSMSPSVSAAQTAHNSCRNTQHQKKTDTATALQSLSTSVSNHADLPDTQAVESVESCIANFHAQDYFTNPDNAAEAVRCAATVRDYMSTFHDEAEPLLEGYETQKSALETQEATCNQAQASLESSFCTFRGELLVSCHALDQCFDDAKTLFDTSLAIIQQSNTSRHVAFRAAQQVKCYIQVLRQSQPTLADVEACDNAQPDDYDTSALTLHVPSPAAKAACVTSLVDDHPCETQWLADYYHGQAWYPTISPNTCTPCTTSAGELWTELTTTNSHPGARDAFGFTAHDSEASAFLFGGRDAAGNPLADMWKVTLVSGTAHVHWEEFSVSGGPASGRMGCTAEWTGSSVLILGGLDGGAPSSELWEFLPDSSSWKELATKPTGLSGHSAVWHAAAKTMFVFGGKTGAGSTNVLSKYDYQSDTWTDPSVSNPPPPRREHDAVLALDGSEEMLVFGGTSSESAAPGTLLNDLWAFLITGNSWRQITQQGAVPSQRYSLSAVWASPSHAMLMFGGRSTVHLNDLLEYDHASSTWSLIPTSGPEPQPRRLHGAAWISQAQVMIVYGGSDANRLQDLWQYRLPSAP